MTIKNIVRLLAIVSVGSLVACQSDDGGPPPAAMHNLSVAVIGNGAVSSADGGISNCTPAGDTGGATPCTETYTEGNTVTLTATAAGGSLFGAWGGGCVPDATDPTICVVTMDADHIVTATFVTQSSGGVGDTFALTRDDPASSNRARLLSFDRVAPGTLLFDSVITGLGHDPITGLGGDGIIAMDFRPSNGQLYGLGRTDDTHGNLYVIDRGTGAATKVAVLTLPSGATLPAPSATVAYEMAFEPGVGTEFIELLLDNAGASKSFSISPDDGVVTATDVANSGKATGVAFTNGFRGARATTAYAISGDGDATSDKLYTLTLPDALSAVGATGVDVSVTHGFAIGGLDGAAYAAFTNGSTPTLYTVNLSTGAFTSVGQIGNNAILNYVIAGLALPQPREPQVFVTCEAKANPLLFPFANCNPGLSLYSFNAAKPGSLTYIGEISGLASGDKIIAMDVRPSTNELYGLGTTGQLYTINRLNGAATAVGTPIAVLAGKLVGFNFDPVADNIRVIGGTADASGVNLTIDPATGTATTLAAMSQAPFDITSAAFDNNNTQPPQSRTFYGIDSTGNRLFTIDPDTGTDPTANPGRITLVATLPFDASAVGGFEIVGNSTAYVTRSNGTSSFLHSLSLTNGTGSQIGAAIGSSSGFSGQVVGLAAPVGGGPLYAATTDAASGTGPKLLKFDPANPAVLNGNDVIGGLTAGETVLALDFRFQNNASVLYLLARGTGDVARLYTVSLSPTVVASPVAITGNIMVPGTPPTNYVLKGTNYGMDVDPQSGQIRIVSDADENLVVDPTTLFVTAPGDLKQEPVPNINALAFAKSYVGSPGSGPFLYNTAPSDDLIMTIDGSQVVSGLGPTGIDNADSDPVAFDIIGGHDGLALTTEHVCDNPPGPTCQSNYTRLWNVDPATGAASNFGDNTKDLVGTDNSPAEDSRMQIGAMAIRFP